MERDFAVLLTPEQRKSLQFPAVIPWGLIEPHRKQAYKNHSQSLETLNSRGGLCLEELYCTLRDESLDPIWRKTLSTEHAARYIETRMELYAQQLREPKEPHE